MANELQWRGDVAIDRNRTVTADISDETGAAVHTGVSLSDPNNLANFVGDMPAGTPFGKYWIRYIDLVANQVIGYDNGYVYTAITITLANGTIYTMSEIEYDRIKKSLDFGVTNGFTGTPGAVDNVTFSDVANPTRVRVWATVFNGNRTITQLDFAP